MVENKYHAIILEEDFEKYIISLKNKIYKLLPLREESLDWEKYLETVLIEMWGVTLIFPNKAKLISLLAKLEALKEIEEFMTYRKTVFECLGILEDIEKV